MVARSRASEDGNLLTLRHEHLQQRSEESEASRMNEKQWTLIGMLLPLLMLIGWGGQ